MKVDLLSEFRRFYKYFDINKKTDCWEWTGYRKNNYGIFCSSLDGNNKTKAAHRISYIIHVSDIPKGMLVCHKCDNPPCVNPSHLFLGTHSDNVIDSVNKGRHFTPWKRLGSKHPGSKLKESDVLKIREKTIWAFGEKAEMARKLGVAPNAIQGIIRYKCWKHLK